MGSQDIQTGRFDQLLRRVAGLYGGGSKVVEVLPELFPILETENTTPELLALSGWRMVWQSTERPAQAALTSASQLRNPADSGVLMAVTKLRINVDGPSAVQAEINNVLFGTPIAGLFRDSRFGVPRRSVGQASSADGIAVGGGLRVRAQTNIPIDLLDDNGIVVLAPGATLDVGATSNNRLMTVNYFWRERLALDSEINFP